MAVYRARKPILKWASIIFTIYIIYRLSSFAINYRNNEYIDRRELRGLKSILIWNSADRIETSAFGTGRKPFIENKCSYNNCVVLTERSTLPLEEYDAIIIHMFDIASLGMPKIRRKHNQRFIFLTQESPAWLKINAADYNNTFNWTMSYRRNSDVKLLYGRVTPKRSAPQTQHDMDKLKRKMHDLSAINYAKNKTKLASWMVSNCKTHGRRESYVQELKQYVNVDVYGNCGDLSCPLDRNKWVSYPECYDVLEAQYKFYFSFENSICTDYATEKFFVTLNHNIVPIVFGGANYSEIAPPHSYINALDFTPKELADYLKLLDANDTLYNEYFWWKSHYRVESGVEQMASHAFCDLCQKLNEDTSVKYYEELVSEWDPKNQCKKSGYGESKSLIDTLIEGFQHIL